MKKAIKIVCICVGAFLTTVTAFILILVYSVIPRQYITTDLNDYGNYTGTYDNKAVNEFITSFFPNKIDESFTDIKYSYRAQKNDTYAFEAYLEFRIEDPDEYQSFISNNVGKSVTEFKYDTNFKEYMISDVLSVSSPTSSSKEDNALPIHYAEIGKILYSDKTQQIIFVAIGVYDGGLVKTDFLCEYFNRFDIDPSNYMR